MKRILIVICILCVYVGGLIYKDKINIRNKAETPPTMSQIRSQKGTPVYVEKVSVRKFEKTLKLSGKLLKDKKILSEVTYQVKSMLEKGNRVFWKEGESVHPGRITSISNRSNLLSGLYDVTLTLDTLPKKKVEQSYIVVEVVYETLKDRIVISRSAVSYRNTVPQVLIVDSESKVYRKSISVADQNDSEVLVSSGIAEGDLIVSSDQRYLSEGEVVHFADRKGL